MCLHFRFYILILNLLGWPVYIVSLDILRWPRLTKDISSVPCFSDEDEKWRWRDGSHEAQKSVPGDKH